MNRLHAWQPIPSSGGTAHVISKANDLMAKGKVDTAVSFIKNFAGPDVQPAVHALLANHHVKNESEWLKQLNLYLDQYKLLPIQLKAGRQPRFFRIFTEADYSIEDGPLVSIIMSAFNAERTIELAVRSVLAQTWRPFELFIVDDQSTDKTFSIAKRLAQEDGRIRVLQNPVNAGPYVSRNRVLQLARGSYVTTHDADDWAFPQRLEMQVEEFRRDGLGAVIMRAVRVNEAGKICRIAQEGPRSHDGVLQTSHVSAMFDATLVREKLGYWDSVRFSADSEFLARTALAIGSRIREVLRPCQLYSDNPGSLTNHPIMGTRERGTSPIRAEYKANWRTWHGTLTPERTYLPLGSRMFPAPEKMLVSDQDIRRVLDEQAFNPG